MFKKGSVKNNLFLKWAIDKKWLRTPALDTLVTYLYLLNTLDILDTSDTSDTLDIFAVRIM